MASDDKAINRNGIKLVKLLYKLKDKSHFSTALFKKVL